MKTKTKSKRIVIFPAPLMVLLGCIFIGLKLTESIDWSWWVVLLPFYWMYAVVVFFIAFFTFAAFAFWILGVLFLGATMVAVALCDLWDYLRGR